MTTTVSTVLGRPLWYELMTTDKNAAETFYKNVVGWTAVPFEGSPQPYSMFKRDGDVPVAGFMNRPEGMNAPPFWAMYIGVPKLEDAAAHIKRLGGQAHSPVIDVPKVGRMQMMADPQGAAFYIYEPDPSIEQQPEGAPEVGEASWLELMTTDAPAAMKFYSELFGWQPSETMDMGEMGKYYMFNRPHGMIGGMMNKPPQLAHVPPNWQIYFLVPDINAAVERIKANGGQILNGPMEVPGGDWVLNGIDPQGAAFSVHAKKAQ
ncbi:MAG TPA: VOC family protein [Vicinamibacterales bacterium]|nr:VOC family protein [Vicinamibacterales bacterium]